MESSIDREAKLDTLLDMIGKIMYILYKKLERHETDIDVDYIEQPTFFPNQEQNQPLQDLDNEQDMYNDQDFIENDEQNYMENNEEVC